MPLPDPQIEWIRGSMDETEAITRLHEISMSKDPIIACSGRLAKQVMPGFTDWIALELERATPASSMMRAASDQAVGILCMTAINALLRGKDPTDFDMQQAIKIVEVTIAGPFAAALAATLVKMRTP